jgi:hypothetical protein
MKDSNEKKITTLKVYKVITIIYTVVIIGLDIATIYGWITGAFDINYIILGSFNAIYCATVAEYEVLKKKSKKENN